MLNWLNGWQRIGVALTGLWLLLVFGSGVIGYLSFETGGGAFVRTIPGNVVLGRRDKGNAAMDGGSDYLDNLLAERESGQPLPSAPVGAPVTAPTSAPAAVPAPTPAADPVDQMLAAQAASGSAPSKSVPPKLLDLTQHVPEAPDNPFRAQMAADQAMNGIPQAPDRHEFQFDDMVVVALVPPLLAWLLIYGAVATVRWIAKGFRRKLG